jgi:hypothetical protein
MHSFLFLRVQIHNPMINSAHLTNQIRTILLSAALFLLGGLSSCMPSLFSAPEAPWQFADLRSLSATTADQPDFDLVAGYNRFAGSDLQFRLDFLDLLPEESSDIFLALDYQPGGTNQLPLSEQADIAWDALLYLPAVGQSQTLLPPSSAVQSDQSRLLDLNGFPKSRLIPRVFRLPWQDFAVISVNPYFLPGVRHGFSWQAFVTMPNSSEVRDHVEPVYSQSSPPGRAPVLLAFWDTFPAYSLAQSLRAWDGAHSGPTGERHGLKPLLESSHRAKVPILLLDLKTPTALSALDLMGGLSLVQRMAAQQLLILPESLPSSPMMPLFPDGLPEWASNTAAAQSRQVGLHFGLPLSQIIAATNLPRNLLPGYRLFFTAQGCQERTSWQGVLCLPYPAWQSTDPQASADGLTLPIRRQLLQNALQNSLSSARTPLLVLGGSLTYSYFGDPAYAMPTFFYLAAHPWMQPLNQADLMTIPAGIPVQLPKSEPRQVSLSEDQSFSPQLKTISQPGSSDLDPLPQAIWDAALTLFAPLPPEPEALPDLRAIYSNQIGWLQTTQIWSANPIFQADCDLDPDQDQLPDCWLASDHLLALIDLSGGRVVELFARTSDGLHQVIAPSEQLLIGMGDPSTWDLAAGEAAEPAGIHGAFYENPPPWQNFQAEIENGALRLTSSDGSLVKILQLTENGLTVHYQTSAPTTVNLPLVLDPWQRFQPGWAAGYFGRSTPEGYLWSLGDELQVQVRTDQTINAYPFNAWQPDPEIPENPNQSYPRGNYLPYPMTLLEIQGTGDFTIELVIKP